MSETREKKGRGVRRVRTIAVAVVLVVLVAHVGGGWYFADQIYAGTLQLATPEDTSEDPGGLGLTFEEVSYDAGLGDTPAWLVPGAQGQSGLWVVIVHGRGGDRAEWLGPMPALHEAGVTTLNIAYRNDPGAPRDPSGEYGFGITEKFDVAAAVDLAVASGAQRVVLMGASMGGGIVMAYLRDGAHPAVVGAILDAPILDLGATVDQGAASLGYPVPGSLVWSAKQIAAWRFGIAWAELDYLRPSGFLEVPVLLFHGTADTVVPYTSSRILAAEYPDLVTYVETASGHIDSYIDDPAGYEAYLLDFLDEIRD